MSRSSNSQKQIAACPSAIRHASSSPLNPTMVALEPRRPRSHIALIIGRGTGASMASCSTRPRGYPRDRVLAGLFERELRKLDVFVVYAHAGTDSSTPARTDDRRPATPTTAALRTRLRQARRRVDRRFWHPRTAPAGVPAHAGAPRSGRAIAVRADQTAIEGIAHELRASREPELLLNM
jgi:hypothetical protein